ncbi:hypothetical protein SGL43_06343 [Streptomyces globisporus]|uniref:Uncharacterized protein n=1 Tax=Streptomyces globisporus TaxID=1908 RepID=A0ABM9H6L2_STRGL|nr:hypothetical protein SGL43_06343 [Streptomyces globisporus]
MVARSGCRHPGAPGLRRSPGRCGERHDQDIGPAEPDCPDGPFARLG